MVTTHTLVSANLPALMNEAVRTLFTAERALSTPQAKCNINFGASNVTVSGSFAATYTQDSAGGISVVPTDYIPSDVIAPGSSAASGKTFTNAADAVASIALLLKAAEDTKVTGGGSLPSGVGVSYSFSNGTLTFSSVLPYVATTATDGSTNIAITNYLA